MERFPCTICKKDCVPYAPTHIDEDDNEVIITHEVDKFCRKCLIDKFDSDKKCPAYQCGRFFLCPRMTLEQVDEIVEDNDSDYEPEDDGRKRKRKNPNAVREARREDNIEEPTPMETTSVADPAAIPMDTTATVPLPAPVTAPNFPRGAKKKTKTIKELAAEQKIPEVHCAYIAPRAQKEYPNCVCILENNLEVAEDGFSYCQQHMVEGPALRRAKLLEEQKKKIKMQTKRDREAVNLKEKMEMENMELESDRLAHKAWLDTKSDNMTNIIQFVKNGLRCTPPPVTPSQLASQPTQVSPTGIVSSIMNRFKGQSP